MCWRKCVKSNSFLMNTLFRVNSDFGWPFNKIQFQITFFRLCRLFATRYPPSNCRVTCDVFRFSYICFSNSATNYTINFSCVNNWQSKSFSRFHQPNVRYVRGTEYLRLFRTFARQTTGEPFELKAERTGGRGGVGAEEHRRLLLSTCTTLA